MRKIIISHNRCIFIFLTTLFQLSFLLGQQAMEIAGALIIGNSEDAAPDYGTIRFNPNTNDFEGWNGSWKSLTSTRRTKGSGSVMDIDGNTYLTVKIGTQIWMRENLRTATYNNGDPITEALLNNHWDTLTNGAWCWFEHNPNKDDPHGKLYNWHAVNDNRALCPTGWHIPTNEEWRTLVDHLGGTTEAGGKMKTSGSLDGGAAYWAKPNVEASNESGFTAVPAGYRDTDGSFSSVEKSSFYWSSTESSSRNAFSLELRNTIAGVANRDYEKGIGFSVRCIMD